MMKPRKPKATEPSLRDKLSAKFMTDFEADFAQHGTDVIQQLREKHPDKYAALAADLIRQAEPPSGVFDKAKSMEDIGIGLLKQVGINDPSEQQIEAALALHNRFITDLEMIAAVHIGMENIREYEERELR